MLFFKWKNISKTTKKVPKAHESSLRPLEACAAPEPLRRSARSGESETIFSLAPRRQKWTSQRKEQKKLKKKIAFSRVEPGSNSFFAQMTTTATRRHAWEDTSRFFPSKAPMNLARTFKCRTPATNACKHRKLDFNFFQRDLFIAGCL
jgi:hypothetical protein